MLENKKQVLCCGLAVCGGLNDAATWVSGLFGGFGSFSWLSGFGGFSWAFEGSAGGDGAASTRTVAGGGFFLFGVFGDLGFDTGGGGGDGFGVAGGFVDGENLP